MSPDIYKAVQDSLPEGDVRHSAWLTMIRCFSSIERVLMRHFAQVYQSSLPRYDVLTALALHRDGLTMGDLASMLMVTKGNITGVVRRLEKDRLVLRRQLKSDRRVQSVKISASGLRLWQRMDEDYRYLIGELLASEDEDRLAALDRALERLRNKVSARAEETSR